MKISRLAIRFLALVFVVAVAILLRMRAAERLPQDFDEPVYFKAGQHYATAILGGDWREVLDYDYVLEHPPLGKLIYGLVFAQLPQLDEIPEQPTNPPPPTPYPLSLPHLRAMRLVAVLFGVLEVLALAILNPLAGLFLAVHTMTIKYTGQAYLEALPSLTSILTVLAYYASRVYKGADKVSQRPDRADGALLRDSGKSGGTWDFWLVLSAVALGLTAAAKYNYAVAGIAIAVHWLWSRHRDLRPRQARAWASWIAPVLLWAVLALAVFYLANPFLWPDPIGRLSDSVLFHRSFAAGDHVQQSGYPVWQPFVWLAMSVPWHPGVFVIGFDFVIALLALLGLPRLWGQRSVFALWLVVGLVLLLLWPTKWPQYILVLTAPLCLSAAVGLKSSIWNPVAAALRRRRSGTGPDPAGSGGPARRRLAWRETRRALLWLLPGLVVLGLIAVYPMLFQTAMSLTDFGAAAIRDGLGGGVWREVIEGLTFRAEPVPVQLFDFGFSSAKEVHWIGPSFLLQLMWGTTSSVLVFEVLWTVLAVVLQTALGLGVALLLLRPGIRFRGLWRALFILPWAIPEFVGALIWSQIFEPRFGWLNLAGQSFAQRLDFPVPASLLAAWQEDPQLALIVVLVAGVWWGFPFMMLAATAALKLVPDEVHDAAAIDGATGWQRFRLVTWPLMLPLLAPAIIIRAIFTFNQFYLFWWLNMPFPAVTYSVMSYWIFDEAGQYAVSAAINLFTVLVLVLLILWFNRRSRAVEGVTYT